jgi:hypothetical protein
MKLNATGCGFEQLDTSEPQYVLKEEAKALLDYGPETLSYISYRCPLAVEDEDAVKTLLGNALCAPRTITAKVKYEFTISKSVPGIEVREKSQ